MRARVPDVTAPCGAPRCQWCKHGAAPGIEPGTSRTRSENHATRPSSQLWIHHFAAYHCVLVEMRHSTGRRTEGAGARQVQLRTPGVEPGSQAWEACMMPLHYVRHVHVPLVSLLTASSSKSSLFRGCGHFGVRRYSSWDCLSSPSGLATPLRFRCLSFWGFAAIALSGNPGPPLAVHSMGCGGASSCRAARNFLASDSACSSSPPSSSSPPPRGGARPSGHLAWAGGGPRAEVGCHPRLLAMAPKARARPAAAPRAACFSRLPRLLAAPMAHSQGAQSGARTQAEAARGPIACPEPPLAPWDARFGPP